MELYDEEEDSDDLAPARGVITGVGCAGGCLALLILAASAVYLLLRGLFGG